MMSTQPGPQRSLTGSYTGKRGGKPQEHGGSKATSPRTEWREGCPSPIGSSAARAATAAATASHRQLSTTLSKQLGDVRPRRHRRDSPNIRLSFFWPSSGARGSMPSRAPRPHLCHARTPLQQAASSALSHRQQGRVASSRSDPKEQHVRQRNPSKRCSGMPALRRAFHKRQANVLRSGIGATAFLTICTQGSHSEGSGRVLAPTVPDQAAKMARGPGLPASQGRRGSNTVRHPGATGALGLVTAACC